jgi:hypothetical protein
MPDYDKELVKREVAAICAHYLGPAVTQGSRMSWRCPECGKEKLQASLKEGCAGCWNEECPLPTSTDAIGIIAHFEQIDPRGRGFLEVLKKGYEILGLESEPQPRKSPGPSRNGSRESNGARGARRRREEARTEAGASRPGWEAGSSRSSAEHSHARTAVELHEELITGEVVDDELSAQECVERPVEAYTTLGTGLRGPAEAYTVEPKDAPADLRDAVYSALLRMCPPMERDLRFWKSRGVGRDTVAAGRFGSITKERTRAAVRELRDRFGTEALLSVPGFSRKPWGLAFTLTDDYALIPYIDEDSNITTIEGRYTGDDPKKLKKRKYVALYGAEPRLYVFPGFYPDQLEAFCEGPICAIVAAQHNIAVGAIKGFRNYKSPGRDGGVLPELEGVDFAGRRIPYIPDVDDPPKQEVLKAAPEAARWLVERQNGRGALIGVPEGKDLDEWLLKLPRSSRRASFTDLIARAIPLDRVLSENGAPEGKSPQDDRSEAGPDEQSSAGTGEVPAEVPGEDGPGGELKRPDSPGAGESEAPGEPAGEEGVEGSASEPVPDGGEAEDELRAKAERLRALFEEVYEKVLSACPLVEQHRPFWEEIGVPWELCERGGFGSMSHQRARELLRRLKGRYGAEALAQLPGFHSSGPGSLSIAFSGSYALVPYRDREGRLCALEGFPVGEEEGGRREPVFAALPGDHLYVFAAGRPEDAEAICEGTLSALKAISCGVNAASLRNAGAHRPAPGAGTLPELAGTDFGGAEVLYVPHLGEPPHQRVMAAAPRAAELLIQRHGGLARIVADNLDGLPLGEWLMQQGESLEERRAVFERLAEQAQTLDEAADAAGVKRTRKPPAGGAKSEGGEPEPGPLNLLPKEARRRLPRKTATVPLTLDEGVVGMITSLVCLPLALLFVRLASALVGGRAGGFSDPLSGPLLEGVSSLLAMGPQAAVLFTLCAGLYAAAKRRSFRAGRRKMLTGEIKE